MFKIISSRIFLLILVLVALFACTSSNDLPPMPDLGIPLENYNQQFLITAPDGLNTFKIGEIIGFVVEVIVDNPIAFESDLSAVILVLQDGKWVAVPNLMKYPEGYYLLMPAKGDPFKWGDASIDPILPNTDKPAQLRVILVGNVVKDEEITDEQVAGYIDIELHP